LVFLKNRFLRIYPTFWASVIVVLMVPFLIESISYLKSGDYVVPESILAKLNYNEWFNFLMLSKVFWATSHDLQAQFNAINSVYWTLAIEFQFYAVIFVSLYFGKYYRYVIAMISLLALLVMFVPVSLNYGLFIYYWPSFSVGIALAYFHRYGVWFEPSLKHKNMPFVILFILILGGINSVTSIFEKSTSNFFFSVCFGMFLWLIANFEKVLTRIKNSHNKLFYFLFEPWLILGAMSYSVYLLHGKIYSLPHMFLRQVLDSDNILLGLLTVIGTLLMCYPFYYFVERRFLSKNYQKIHQEMFTRRYN
ncbi:MAG: acyltransferase family protein, partial [Methyloprofundus sp.]|nr:acyltransferase family protein [Methyloprofundus sp.]